MRTRRRHENIDGDDTSFWVSFSDVATALMMVFILLVVLQLEETSALSKLGITPSQRAATIKMKEYLLKRQQLIERLNAKFDKDGGIDKETGTFTIKANLLFPKDKWVLNPGIKPDLSRMVGKYAAEVLSPEFRDSIAQIDIEGHADNDAIPGLDPYLSNLELTQNRARAVAAFVVSDPSCMNETLRKQFKRVLSVNGRSSEQLIYKDPVTKRIVDKANSRRVVIKFRLKDEQLNDVAGASK